MKDRLREAVFNLIAGEIEGKHAIDLFAGTGALGLEAISRGAARATFIERHFPTAALVGQNIERFHLADCARVHCGDAFVWAQRQTTSPGEPWLVFCSPPYAFYTERAAQMQSLLATITERAPPGSIVVVEADERAELALLPEREKWDIRQYPPAVLAIFRKT